MTHKLSDADLRRMADELRAMDPGRWDDLLLASHVMATFKRFQWQPIETAPRDGTKILAYCRAGNSDYYYQSVVRWRGRKFKDSQWKWRHTLDDSAAEPTDWMPLPKPPKRGAT